MFGNTSTPKADRLEKELAEARGASQKAADALETARDATISATADGDPKAVEAARKREAAARAEVASLASRVDDIGEALVRVREGDAAAARNAENIVLRERLAKAHARSEIALKEGIALAARGLVLVGEAIARGGIAGNCADSLRGRGMKDVPAVGPPHRLTVEDMLAEAINEAYVNRSPEARWEEKFSVTVNVACCATED